jgi:hypothetical protein
MDVEMRGAHSELIDRGTAAAAWVTPALGVAALVLVVIWVAWSDSAVGADAQVAAALAVLSVAWLVFLLRPRLDRRLQITALVLVGTCAAVLNHYRPNSPAFLPGVPPLSRRVGYLAPAGEAWVPDDWLR